MAIESTTITTIRPTFTDEQKEAWKKAKLLLKALAGNDSIRYRSLHVAMSELRSQYKTHKGPIECISKNPDKATQKHSLDLWHNLRKKVDLWKAYLADPGSKKLYLITDPTLSDSQKAVQSAHCSAQFIKEHPNAPWVNGTLIILAADLPLDVIYSRYKSLFDYSTKWCEEDLDNRITSIAFLDDYRVDCKGIRSLRLL